MSKSRRSFPSLHEFKENECKYGLSRKRPDIYQDRRHELASNFIRNGKVCMFDEDITNCRVMDAIIRLGNLLSMPVVIYAPPYSGKTKSITALKSKGLIVHAPSETGYVENEQDILKLLSEKKIVMTDRIDLFSKFEEIAVHSVIMLPTDTDHMLSHLKTAPYYMSAKCKVDEWIAKARSVLIVNDAVERVRSAAKI